jgi:uncharacterized membrane protein YecN with MAPEG domain
MKRETGRLLVVLAVIALIFWSVSALYGRHYYRVTYAWCTRPNSYEAVRAQCSTWHEQTLFQILAIAVAGVAGWMYNERRAPS